MSINLIAFNQSLAGDGSLSLARRLPYSTAGANPTTTDDTKGAAVAAHDKRTDEQRVMIPPGALVAPLEQSIDPDSFTPRLLALLSNALVWRESHELRRQFNLGTNEWRVLSSLALKPGYTSGDVAAFLELNKAVVSKSTNVLLARGLIVLGEGPRGSRPMYLTTEGAEMHDRMLPISTRGQEIILEDIPEADVARLNHVLREMLKKTRELHRVEVEAGRPG